MCCCRMAVPTHGVYYFKTVIPGNEVLVGWGDDPAPHIHYDVVCRDCADNAAFSGGTYDWWGKVYPEDLCKEPACGKPGGVHQVQERQSVNGENLHIYDFVFPSTKP
jgi:protocatechuate 3,4-dioxygenase beta subunit